MPSFTRFEKFIIALITADILIDIICAGLNLYAMKYFTERTVPTPDVQIYKALDRERLHVDELRNQQSSNQSSILLRGGQVLELQKRLEDLLRENTRLRGELNSEGGGL